MNRPVVLGCCLWITGYVLAMAVPNQDGSWLIGAGLLAALISLHVLRLPGRQPLSLVLLVGIAFGYYQWNDQRNVSALLSLAQQQANLDGSEVTLHGRFTSPVSVDGDRASFTLEATSLRFQDDTAFPLRGESVQVTLRLAEQAQQGVVAGWRRGDAVTLGGVLRSPAPARNFGGFDYRRYLRLHHTHWLLTASGVDQALVQPAAARISATGLLRWNDALRAALSARMDRIFPAAEQAGFMKSMLIGYTDDLDPNRFQQFSELGLTHILAISGLNVAVFLGAVIWLLRRFKLTRETILLVCIWLLPCYILVTGASPSIVRAGLMSMIALIAARKGFMKDVLHIMAIVAWAMLLWNPYYVLDVSFQLSFLVTLGLIVGVQRTGKLLEPWIPHTLLRNTAAITLVSQLISFPVSIYYFNQFSLISWAANAVLVPIISMVVFPAGLAALLIGFLYMPAGKAIGTGIGWLNQGIFRVTDWLQSFQTYKTIWPTPSLTWMAAYYLCMLAIYALWRSVATAGEPRPLLTYDKRRGKRRSFRVSPLTALLLSLSTFALLLWIGYSPDRFHRKGSVQFLDVGQGDAILIRTPYNKHLLIDGGGTVTFGKPGEAWKLRKDPYEVGAKLLVPLLKKRGVHQLDFLVLTHEDADHSGGLQAVAEQIPIKQFLFNGTLKSSPGIAKLFGTLLAKHVPLLPAGLGDWLVIDPQTRIKILYPLQTMPTEVSLASEQNALSVVLLLEMQGTRWLFTGDMEKASEAEVLSYLRDQPADIWGSPSSPDGRDDGFSSSSTTTGRKIDVLKVAHHGSKTSTTPEWVTFWQPAAAVISVGEKNVYGHPSPDVVGRLEDGGAQVFRTDRSGEIQMEIDVQGIKSRTKLEAN
ncbi:DNA internalization-related competence protein ComEC/Rec2 [Paenibacillus whitsoniae]|uniref:DNA internalization-related competence protein ComEC/Rec2 n=1 Tax=Paenibacillus whitsoniae TaxID=2496558 RepID=A0A3S0A3A5_9BACL|nr:DNA internalization-related competence protein ComEC/Rec2 [Paenibacillus whitsoniae]RTE08514.1 DNA internalization-related competence protein ComEC/Rec2 [Paenibacillus whitsoniae]